MSSERPTTIWSLVEAAAAQHPDRVVLSDEHGRSLTTEQLRGAAERVAAGLEIRAGDTVSWQIPTSLEAVLTLVALARIGVAQNPIIPILREAEVRHITECISTTLLIVPERWRGFEHGQMARDIAGDSRMRVITIDLEGDRQAELALPSGDPTVLGPPAADDQSCRWYYFTSGTTAAPKGVRHSDATLIASSAGMIAGLGVTDGDVYPIAWPVAHIGGATMLTTVLRSGGKLVLFESFDPSTIAVRMAACGPTILGTGVPFFRAYLAGQRAHGAKPLFPALRAFTAGGAPTPPELIRELDGVFANVPVVNSYGLTEFPIATAPSPLDPPQRLAATVGPPSPGVQVRVVDGELRLKGPQQFLGYADPAHDADAIDNDGWLRTGDLGSVTDDGAVAITGRLKDVIIRNGENISALQIEDTLLRHPDIVDVTVLGLPDARTGERVCAVVVVAPGRQITLADVFAHCAAEGLAKQKAPEQLHVVDAIQRSSMGKVVKADLLAALAGP
jgi:cyclohexanecarboxylate-CoA ligase